MSVSFDKLYWTRIGMGVLGGYVADQLFSLQGGATGEWNGLTIAIAVYLASFYVGKYVLLRGLPQDKQSKLYTTGIGGYVMLFIFTWILLFTLSQI